MTHADWANPTLTRQASVADELIKLAQLRDAGVLSPEEFEGQKARAMLGLTLTLLGVRPEPVLSGRANAPA